MSRRQRSGHCSECGTFREYLEKDHITPRAEAKILGWTRTQIESPDNHQYLCSNCHDDKTRRDIARLRLIRPFKTRGKSDKPAWNRGIKASPELRLKLSLAHKGRPHPNKGVKRGPLTPDHRAKIGAAHKGRKLPEAQRLKMIGRVRSEETKRAIGAKAKARIALNGHNLKGSKRSIASKEKMRQSWSLRKKTPTGAFPFTRRDEAIRLFAEMSANDEPAQ